jgi:hypothetical protein
MSICFITVILKLLGRSLYRLLLYTSRKMRKRSSKLDVSEKDAQKILRPAKVPGDSRRYFPCILCFALCHVVLLTQLIHIFIYIEA